MKLAKSQGKSTLKKYGWMGLIITAFILFVVGFLYFDRRNQISAMIQGLGGFGIAVAVLLMAGLCMTPIPSEGIVVLYLKIYGVIWGTTIAWVGASLSSLVIFVVARYYGQGFIQRLVTPERFKQIDDWVKRKGTLGLFIVRLLPIPAFAVNYVAGVIPSIRLWPYLWTAALSIIPYYVATALVFLGVAREIWTWLIIGGLGLIAFWGVGFAFNRRRII